jgi:HK97 family phage portal protein
VDGRRRVVLRRRRPTQHNESTAVILDRLLEHRTTLASPSSWLTSALVGESTVSGVSVTTENCLAIPAVQSAVQLIAGSLSMLPLKLFRRLPDGGKIVEQNHQIHKVLTQAFNPEMDAFVGKEILTTSLLLHGNAYFEIQRDNRGRVQHLWYLHSDMMSIDRGSDGLLHYHYRLASGELVTWIDNPIYPPVLHIKAHSRDGIIGRSVISQCRETLGLSKAAETYASTFFANGARPGGVLQTKGQVSPEAHQRLRQSWTNHHSSGLNQAHRVAILEEGVEYKATSVPPEDSQLLETRKFQVEDIARLFRVPSHLIGSLDRATFSNIEQQALEYVVHSLGPWFKRIETAINRQILGQSSIHFSEFVPDALLRSDTKTRMSSYATAIQNGIMTVNEVRALENRNGVEGGDQVFFPLNMAPIEGEGVQNEN